MLDTVLQWVMRGLLFGSVIMFGASGEILTQKSGNMNLGTPGIMCIGGAFGFGGVYLYEYSMKQAGTDPNTFLLILIPLVCAFAAAALAGLLFCFLTTTLRANQNVTGLAMTIFGTGLSKFFCSFIIPEGEVSVKANRAGELFNQQIPISFGDSAFGKIVKATFFSYGFMFYIAIIAAIGLAFFLKKTRKGMNLRAVGESPATADAAGISVTRNKYFATMIGAGISGLGGLCFVLDYSYGSWSTAAASGIEALGWLAVALVIFATWNPLNLLWGSALFGLLYWLYCYVSVFGFSFNSSTSALLETVPYIVTIVVLIVTSIRKSRESQPPESLGLSYFREDR